MLVLENQILLNTQLIENLKALYKSIEQNRPSGVKVNILKVYLFVQQWVIN
jgi:ribosomal protein L1